MLLLAQAHEDFRVAELEALADLYGVNVDLSGHDPNSPFMVIDTDSVESAKRLVERAVLTREVYELYAESTDLESLQSDVKECLDRFEPYRESTSFKFDIVSFHGSRTRQEMVALIESFKFLDLRGPIRMKNPEEVFVFLEEYDLIAGRTPATTPKRMFFGRKLASSSRDLIDKYDLKKRKYIGTTSFEAELSLVTCNIAQCAPGTVIYDPFVGTGSFLVGAAEFGSVTVGSDIDVRMVRGDGPKRDISTNFSQYGTSKNLMDVLAVDFTNNCFRQQFKFDAIICDPPYGVREGLRVLGSKNPEKFADKPDVILDGVPAHLRRDYIPPKRPYQFSSLLVDLLNFASSHLKPNGRLCFWMPTANEDMVPHMVPDHPDLDLVIACVQPFNKWSRRMLCFRRKDNRSQTEISKDDYQSEEFRDKYFRGFRSESEPADSTN